MMKSTIVNKEGQLKSITGSDGMDVLRIRTLMLAIKMLVDTDGRMQVTRGWNMKRCLTEATTYTGNKYKRTETSRAMGELQKIIDLRLHHIEVVEA